MRKSIYVFLTVIVCGVIAMLGYNQHRTRRELDEMRASVQSPAEGGENPAAQVPPRRADEIESLLASAAIAASAKMATQAPAPVEEAKPAARRLTQEEVTENVLASFAKETRDPEWSRQALEKIEGPIRQALPPGSRILSTDCRTTMCVVKIQHPDTTVAQSWLLPGLAGWPGAVFIPGVEEDNGALVQTIVPIKEGATPAYAGL